MYATCAGVGCTARIEYDPDEDSTRPRYCPYHESIMDARLARNASRESLYISTARGKDGVQKPLTPPKMVVLVCPICKARKTSPENLQGYSDEPCETEGCHGMMIYHKDVKP